MCIPDYLSFFQSQKFPKISPNNFQISTFVTFEWIHAVLVFYVLHFIFQVAYTFDAGPNSCLFLMESEIPEVLALVKYYFPPEQDER